MAVAAFERVLELDPDLREMPPGTRCSGLILPMTWSPWAHRGCQPYLEYALSNTSDPIAMESPRNKFIFFEGALDDAERCFRRAAELAPNDHVLFESRQARHFTPRPGRRLGTIESGTGSFAPGSMMCCTRSALRFIASSAARPRPIGFKRHWSGFASSPPLGDRTRKAWPSYSL